MFARVERGTQSRYWDEFTHVEVPEEVDRGVA
jgi:hypothetical protein